VNNAAVLTFGESEWQPTELLAHQFDVNVFGVHRVTKAFLPELRKVRGRVVNMIRYTIKQTG
jgi:3-hydroxybutyrate dehydrogenase